MNIASNRSPDQTVRYVKAILRMRIYHRIRGLLFSR